MDNKNTISVIVPVYNVEDYLNECVESIVSQTYGNLEIILVDDGSLDKSGDMCDEWAEKDSRIKVIHKQNGGLSSARNAGLDCASGDYINFIDSDDFLEQDAYDILMREMKEQGVDVVKFAHIRYLDGRTISQKHIDKEKMYDNNKLLDCYFYHREDICAGVCDKLYRAELLEGIRFPDRINSEDYYFNIQLYQRIEKMYYDNRNLYYYRMREGSISRSDKLDKHYLDKVKISDAVAAYVEENMPERIEDANVFQALARFMIYYDSMFKGHTKENEVAWMQDLQAYGKYIKKSKRLSKAFKCKYYCLSKHIREYVEIKKLMHKE